MLLVAVCIARAAPLSPFPAGWPLVDNVSTRDARLASPIWTIASAPDGEIIAGTNDLLVFDGAQWNEIVVPSGYAFRSLAFGKNGRGWVGGASQLGFIEKSTTGQWCFTSLLAEARAAGFATSEEIWHVAATSDGVVFVASQQILRWDGARFQIWTRPCAPRLFAHTVSGELYVHQPGTGLLQIRAGGPVVVRPSEQLPEGLLLWAVAPNGAPRQGAIAEGWIIGTNDGAFRLTASGAMQLAELSRALTRQLATCAAMLDDGTLAIGTYQSGIVLASADGRVRDVLDRRSGLMDDRVNCLFADAQGGLWAGLSLGLARIETKGAVAIFDGRNGIADGPLAQVFSHRGETFAATSRTLYRFAPTSEKTRRAAMLEALPPLNTFVWDTAVLGDDIIAAGFGGIWRISVPPEKNNNAPRDWSRAVWIHEHHVSADVFRVIASRYLSGTLFFFEGHALKALQRTERDWVPRILVADLDDTPVSLIEDEGGDIWVSLMLKGVRRYRVKDDVDGLPLTLRLVQSFEPGKGLPPGSVRPRLSLLGEHVIAFTETDVLATTGAESDIAFTPVPGFENWTGVAAASRRHNATGENAFAPEAWWIAQDTSTGRAGAPVLFHVTLESATPDGPDGTRAAARFRIEPAEANGLDGRDFITSLNIATDTQTTQNALWVGGATRLLRVTPNPAAAPPGIRLQRVLIDGQPVASANDRAAHAQPLDGSSNMDFRMLSPVAATGDPVFFQTRLLGAESDWTPRQRSPERTFAGLAPGAYVFEARAVDKWGRPGPALALHFNVPTPWFRSAYAIIGYTIAALLLIALAVSWRMRQLHRRADELNRIVGERTRELATANSIKTEFLERISHEIRNPLNGILGLVAMLREIAPGERAGDLTRSLRACAKSLVRVFDDVLKFTRLEHGQVALHEKPFALDALVAEIAALFRVGAQRNGCEISIRREGDPLNRLIGDAEKIETILANFVGNALKHAPGFPIEILVQCDQADETGANITFNVTDQGPGIPPGEQEYIFERFARGSHAKRQRVPGTGLGLATCRALAGLLGGHVAVESPSFRNSAGGGCTFFLSLRLKRDNNPAPESQAQGERAPAIFPTSNPGGPARALIVEDQPYNRIVVHRIAEKLGFLADVASDAAGALACVSKNKYDVVLLDWELPDMDGDTVARQIRAQPDSANTIIIGTTAHDSAHIRRQGIAAGMDAFALKPFEQETIARLINEARASRGGASAEPATGRTTSEGGLDFRVFRFVGNDDAGEAGRAAQLYLEILDNETAALAAAVAAADCASAARSAHRLKSHAGMVNAAALREQFERIQREAATMTPMELRAAHEEARRLADELGTRVRAWLSG